MRSPPTSHFGKTLQHTATQHTATHCRTLLHTATHCNTPDSVSGRHRHLDSESVGALAEIYTSSACQTFPQVNCCVSQCVAVCCNVLQCVAVCCSVLQCVAMCCSMLECVGVCWSVLRCVAVCCSVLQCVAVCCSVLQCVAVCCSVLQCRILHETGKLSQTSACY